MCHRSFFFFFWISHVCQIYKNSDFLVASNLMWIFFILFTYPTVLYEDIDYIFTPVAYRVCACIELCWHNHFSFHSKELPWWNSRLSHKELHTKQTREVRIPCWALWVSLKIYHHIFRCAVGAAFQTYCTLPVDYKAFSRRKYSPLESSFHGEICSA
jgi:hypothetical protein